MYYDWSYETLYGYFFVIEKLHSKNYVVRCFGDSDILRRKMHTTENKNMTLWLQTV